MSVCSVRSCASSSTTTEYAESVGSSMASRSSMPSVMYLMRVARDVASSNRTEYPTVPPTSHPTSAATRFAMEIAATRRGCVTAMDPYPARYRNWGIWVVFPLPVSPTTTSESLFRTSSMSASLTTVMGRLAGTSGAVAVPEASLFLLASG